MPVKARIERSRRMEPGAAPDPRRWQALALVCVAFFMVILDVAIVNVALPSIQEDLGISATLQWIVTAYSLAFGGFLLLGGRAADLLGRRKVFMFGMVLFTGGSLACGLADSGTQLIIFRAIQGLGGAIVSPATLAIISDSFRHDQAERNKAFRDLGRRRGQRRRGRRPARRHPGRVSRLGSDLLRRRPGRRRDLRPGALR